MNLHTIMAGNLYSVMQAFERSQAIISFKTDGTILDANENFCKAVGYSRDEIIGKSHRMFVKPDDAHSAEYAAFWKRLASGEFDRGQYKRIGKNGRKFGLKLPIIPLFVAVKSSRS